MDNLERLKKLIEDALANLPAKVVANKYAEGTLVRGPSHRNDTALPPPYQFDKSVREGLAIWLRERVAPILETIGTDKKAAAVFAKILPQPWKVCPDDTWPLYKTPKAVRPDLVYPLILRAIFATIYGRGPRFEDMKQPPPLTELSGQRQADIRMADEFWKAPAAWLWSLWYSWCDITGCKEIPGLPEWPDLKDYGFYHTLPYSIELLAGMCPGETATQLRRALEELLERLAGEAEAGDGTKSKRKRKRGAKPWRDAALDKKIYEAKKSDGRSNAELARDFYGNMSKAREVGRAIDSHRHKLRRKGVR